MHVTDAVQRIATAASDLDGARRRLDTLLRRVIGYDFAAFSTVDPASGLWTSCYVSGLNADGAAERENTLFELEMAGDVNTFADLAAREVPVATLHAATEGRPTRAKRWAPLLEPYQVVDEARGVLRWHGQNWGTFVLYRTGRAETFSPLDVAMLTAAVPSIARLFRLMILRMALTPAGQPTTPPGAFTVDRDGSLSAVSAAASDWLQSLDDRGRVPAAVRALAATARATATTAVVSVPRRQGGFVTLFGSPVVHGDGVAVVIDAARPAAISDVLAHAYGLTDREREVAALAARGRSTREMARELQLSPFTVTDHLKSLYAKVGVTSRSELVAVLEQRTSPRAAGPAQSAFRARYLDHNIGIAPSAPPAPSQRRA